MPDQDKIVQLPDGRTVSFPAAMGDEQISAAIQQNAMPTQQPGGLQGGLEELNRSLIGVGTGRELLTGVKAIGRKVKEKFQDPRGGGLFGLASDVIGGLIAAEQQRAASAAEEPDFAKRIIKNIPLVGGRLAKAGQMFAEGKIARGFGASIGLGLGTAIAARPAVVGETLSTVGGAAKSIVRAPSKLYQATRPPLLERGTENIFRAARPSPTETGFRNALETARADLAEIERTTPSAAKGGFVRADLRVREFVDNANARLRSMYTNERAAQINAAADEVLDLSTAPQAVSAAVDTVGGNILHPEAVAKGLQTGARVPPRMTLADADKLARAVNVELRGYESMTASERAAANVSEPNVASLKALDRYLSESINSRLHQKGMPGIENYERRYAALSQVRDVLQNRMNTIEAARYLDRMREFITPRNVGLSIGQAARASGGKLLQRGLRQLEKTGIEPPTVTIPPPIRTTPFDSGGGGVSLLPPRLPAAPPPGMAPSPVIEAADALLARAAPEAHVRGTLYTDAGLRNTFSIPNSMSLRTLEVMGAIRRTQEGFYEVVEPLRPRATAAGKGTVPRGTLSKARAEVAVPPVSTLQADIAIGQFGRAYEKLDAATKAKVDAIAAAMGRQRP